MPAVPGGGRSVFPYHNPIHTDASIAMALPPKWYQFLVCAFASLGSSLFGYDLGVIAGAVASNNFTNTFQPADAEVGAVVSVFTGGAFIGAGLAGPCGDWLGRRLTVLIGAVIFILGGGLQTGAQALSYLYAGRREWLISFSQQRRAALMNVSDCRSWSWVPRYDNSSLPGRTLSPRHPWSRDGSAAVHAGNWISCCRVGFVCVLHIYPRQRQRTMAHQSGDPSRSCCGARSAHHAVPGVATVRLH